MKRIYTISITIISLLFSCEKKEEGGTKECTNPDFGETVSAIAGLEQGIGFISITNVWGSYMEDLTFEWDHGDVGPELYGLEPGVYTVTITDTEGCLVTQEFDLTLDETGSGGYEVGDTGPAGGIVFYVNEDGTGLEAAPVSSIWTNIAWGCEDMEISTMQDLGTGKSNTLNILNNCFESNIAAELSNELAINGFDDWYLPSINELSSLAWVIYQEDIAGFPNGNYWSSSEAISSMAFREYLPDGGSEVLYKSSGANVIAIRTFGGTSDGTGDTGGTGDDGDTGGSETCTTSVTDVDGNNYEVVKIGDQCWMGSNLRTTRYRNGDSITTDLDYNEWNYTKSGAYAINPSVDFTSFLYNGYAITDPRGICPEGWHVPTENEILSLLALYGGEGIEAAEALKSRTGWCSTNPFTGNYRCENGNNSSGFNGRPGGARAEGSFIGKGNVGAWWTANGEYALHISGITWEPEGPGNANASGVNINDGISCRCIKD